MLLFDLRTTDISVSWIRLLLKSYIGISGESDAESEFGVSIKDLTVSSFCS